MKINFSLFIILCSFFLTACVTKREAVMPYYNFGYTSGRLLPVSVSNANFVFRIWINNGTSIDRVISVSKDKDFGDEAYLVEMGTLFAKHKNTDFYKKTKIIPKDGIDGFIKKIDSLKLFGIQDNPDSSVVVATDRPFSLYVVEIKENGKYHCFKFNTSFPQKEGILTKYTTIQQLIFEQFNYTFYMKR